MSRLSSAGIQLKSFVFPTAIWNWQLSQWDIGVWKRGQWRAVVETLVNIRIL
jgi:hypothetical protein